MNAMIQAISEAHERISTNTISLSPLLLSVYDEVSERKEFMEEARLLGISSCYEAALNCEIAQKIKEMESIVN